MKTIIIDEREIRKQQYLGVGDEEKLNTMCTISKDFESFQVFDEFSLLAIHQSLLIETGRFSDVLGYAEVMKKPLILFSGGITQNIVSNSGKLLKINAADFYSKITQFLMEYPEEQIDYPLLKFMYGKEWEKPLLLRYKSLLWKYGAKETSQMVNMIEKNDRELEYEIREILNQDSDTISTDWINNRLNEMKEAAL